MDVLYEFLSANRLAMGSMGGLLDGVIASKRITMAQQGVQTCGDVDEECSVSERAQCVMRGVRGGVVCSTAMR